MTLAKCVFLFAIGVFLYLTLTATAFGQSDPSGRVVISGKELQRQNILRLSDIFLLLDNWHLSTVDGFDWLASPAGLSTFQRQNWTVLIDGEKYELGAFDLKNINLLPIGPEMIDSVEVFTIPQLNHSEFGERGLIHFHTSSPANRFVAAARVAAGNETGDPGPRIFSDRQASNVDRIGPDNSLGIYFSGPRWQFLLRWRDQSHYSTDSRIQFRNPGSTNRELRTDLFSPSLRLKLKTNWGTHQLSFNHTTSSNLFSLKAGGASPVFFRPLSQEVYSTQIFTHAGLQGEMPFSAKQDLIYRFRYAKIRLEQHPNAPARINFNWDMDRFYGNVENHYRGDNFSGRVGVGWERITTHTRYVLQQTSITNNKIYGSLRYSPAQGVSQILAFQAVSNASSRAYKTSSLLQWTAGEQDRIGIGITWSERLVEEDNSIWFWSEQGYGLLADLGVDYSLVTDFHQSKVSTVDIDWHHEFNPKLRLTVAGFFRRFKNLYLEEQNFRYQDDTRQFVSPAVIHTDKGGQVLGLSVKIEQQLFTTLKHSLLYYTQDDIAGERIFRQSWNAIPAHKIKYVLDFQPNPRFSVVATAQYLSGTKWEEYRDTNFPAESGYSWKVPSSLAGDVSFQKWFWGDRIRAGLLLRNLFGENLRYHPLGAQFDFQVYGTLELQIARLLPQ